MKLNNDCVRDVMLYIEENCIYEDDDRGNRRIGTRTIYQFTHDEGLSSLYTEDEITYTVVQLFLDDMVVGSLTPFGFNFNWCDVTALSPKGHEFLDNIKDDTIWKKAKNFVGEHLTSTSFSIIANVASKFATEALMGGVTPK